MPTRAPASAPYKAVPSSLAGLYSVESEQGILGSLLADPRAWSALPDLLAPADFYRPEHQQIFTVMRALHERATSIDLITVADALGSSLERLGGRAYLGELIENLPSSSHVAHYAGIVMDRAQARRLWQVGQRIVDLAQQINDRPVAELVDQAEQEVFALSQSGRSAQGFQAITPLLEEAITALDARAQNPQAVTGVPSGFMDLDRMTAGFQKGDLVIIAGRPSMGKTAFAMNIAENYTKQGALPTAVFSLEMGATQLAMRLLSSGAMVDAHRIRTGHVTEQDWERLTKGHNDLTGKPLYIDDTSGITPWEIRARCRRLQKEHGLGLIVIDYLQLIQSSAGAVPARAQDTRATEVGAITRALKGLAREMEAPVLLLSQLNRGVEQRTNKRPLMSDLRESGAIEQDADTILFLYRDNYYNPENASPNAAHEIAEVIIGKQRNGPVATVRLRFDSRITRFDNCVEYQDFSESGISDMESPYV